MPLQSLLSNLPLEVRRRILVYIGQISLARHYPEYFWAIAPEILRVLVLGKNDDNSHISVHSELALLYPASACFIEKLTLICNWSSTNAITFFLERFPHHRRLKHLTIRSNFLVRSYYAYVELPYQNLLDELLECTPCLTRLSFIEFQPSPFMISNVSMLTHLDLRCYESAYDIPLPGTLEVLSVCPYMIRYLQQPTPTSLRVLIAYADNFADNYLIVETRTFIEQTPSITSVAIVDLCKFILF